MVNMLAENFGCSIDDFIAFVIAISVVIGFEIIQIEITDSDMTFLADRLLNMLIKWHIAW